MSDNQGPNLSEWLWSFINEDLESSPPKFTRQQRYMLSEIANALENQGDSTSEKVSPTPPNSGKRWDEEEEALVKELYTNGKKVFEIAKEVGRTTTGVLSRVEKMGLDTNPEIAATRANQVNSEESGMEVAVDIQPTLAPPTRLQGHIKWFNHANGYGFIEWAGEDLFVHQDVNQNHLARC